MSNGAPSTTYSESNLTNTTPADFNQPPNVNAQGLSEAAINQLIDQKMQSVLNALGKSMTERAQMQLEIDALKTSEQELKNQVENVILNNEQLIERVEKVEIENAQLKQMLNEMEISGQIKRLKKTEREEWKNETRKIEEKVEELELNLRNESEKRHELEMLRKEMGEIGGAGHFFGNDKDTYNGGERDQMRGEELVKVQRLLVAGEKKINLKFLRSDNLEVAESGWTIQFKSARKDCGGDGKYFYLWISNKEGGAKFKATAQEIGGWNGEEANRRELQSEKDGMRQRIKYEKVADYSFVRFNITIL
ncbi:unnamed protein product [Oikopleura dioica]|uniref:Uncharacterized protein n=1 Tax=Oikopleura dioica TaxID=34765 RepID=E4Y907_OIKDI|nr:unnamed protein product [Oikopleura dioica]